MISVFRVSKSSRMAGVFFKMLSHASISPLENLISSNSLCCASMMNEVLQMFYIQKNTSLARNLGMGCQGK